MVQILPVLAGEKRFALKGGTAIKLFEHDLPRLSVDIDLTWLLVGEFASEEWCQSSRTTLPRVRLGESR